MMIHMLDGWVAEEDGGFVNRCGEVMCFLRAFCKWLFSLEVMVVMC